ncbi:hypothetical protein [Methanococcoides alaskense]|uniref:Membrane protein n=1 Tax=Methanococcoides alaskense TaxID=325778 RepID=A0AA90U259_9EURY|nr:hypothetical protein [Methanococcoides alaskense]MDR6223824.1 putative membrane protein [Methanococcoides alaskense]
MGIIDKNQNIISEIIGFIFLLSALNNLFGIGIPYISNSNITYFQSFILMILGIYLMGYKRIPRELAPRLRKN